MKYEKVKQITNKYNCFYRQKKGNLELFSYHYMDYEPYKKHPSSREIRGLVFDKKGEIVARPFPKFFNFSEPICKVSEDDRVTTTKKIDGSLATAFLYGGEIRFASKGSFHSWVVKRANKFVTEDQKQLVKEHPEYTCIFELRDPKHPVVIRAEKARLVLVGMRHTTSGTIVDPRIVINKAKMYQIPSTEIVHKSNKVKDIIDEVKNWEEKEGVVGYTKSGLFKIKSEWYVKRHRFVHLTDPKIKELYIKQEIDDIYPMLGEEQRKYLDEYTKQLRDKIEKKIDEVQEFFNEHSFKTRKELALTEFDGNPVHSRKDCAIFFNIYDGTEPYKAVREHLKRKWA